MLDAMCNFLGTNRVEFSHSSESPHWGNCGVGAAATIPVDAPLEKERVDIVRLTDRLGRQTVSDVMTSGEVLFVVLSSSLRTVAMAWAFRSSCSNWLQ